LGDDYELIMALGTQAQAAIGIREKPHARSLADEALSIAQRIGDPYRTALVLAPLARLEYCEQNYARAQAYYEQALGGLRELGTMREEPFGVLGLALTRLQQGDLTHAHALFCECLKLYKSRGSLRSMAEPLVGFGALASERGMQAQAVHLLTAAISLGGSFFMSLMRVEGMEVGRYLAAARAQLTEQEFEKAQREGRAQTLDGAIEYALSLPLVVEKTPVRPKDELNILTAREREIVALIGQGKTNGEISAELVLSKRTVEKHMANILSKLELNSRAQVIRWGMEHHLAGRPAP
jgi:DNA-binding CsgD family transcriptional regulator